uniref:Uncharacterized protein n=1 Tax=Romanomermis culicivorax TaxID=13658 RepID=A0A915IGX9_ROMCU
MILRFEELGKCSAGVSPRSSFSAASRSLKISSISGVKVYLMSGSEEDRPIFFADLAPLNVRKTVQKVKHLKKPDN